MSNIAIGWDVGGAHLKVAGVEPGGRLAFARIAPCPLWRGLDQLEAAIDALQPPSAGEHFVTMTGELVDLFADRAEGVAALAAALVRRLGPGIMVYAGAKGFVGADHAARLWRDVASANWRATAEALALDGDGLLIDVGSTTTDLIPFSGGRVAALGSSDAERMAADELLYLGVARTPVMAIAPKLPFAGAWVAPMAEHFATSADVFRLTGELPDGADLHETSDGGPKTEAASARRLLRMVGADLDDATASAALGLARFLAEASLRRIADAAAVVLSRVKNSARPTVFGAGVGRFLAEGVARRLGLMYRDVGALWSQDPALASAAADCAPAVAVARLGAAARGDPAPQNLSTTGRF